MQRSLRAVLTGTVFVFLASCGGGGEAPADPQSQAANAARTEKRLDLGDGSARARKVYIVRLAEPAAAGYDGNIGGLRATRPAKGTKFDSRHPDVVNYRAHLASRQDAVMRSAGVAKALRNYGYVFNGFAAQMSDEQAAKLAGTRGVLSVSKDEIRHADTSSTPTFIGLTGKDGFWKEQGAKGEDIIIGVIDSGIWPEHPSFSDRKKSHGHGHDFHSRGRDEGDFDYKRIRGWHGICQAGEQFTADDCNRKLIGARYYNAGFGGDAGIKAIFPYEFNSPRDYNGHGTHTSSTAGGNEDVRVTGDAAAFGKISGIAPRARIAMYKALWHDASVPKASGTTSDLRRRHRRGGRRRRGRHQLFDQRHAHQLRRPGRDRVPVRRRCRRVRRHLGRQQRPATEHGGAPVALGHHGGRGHAQPRRQGLGHARQRHHVHRRVVHRRGRAGAADRFDAPPACPAPTPPTLARCFPAADNGRHRPCSTRPRWPARSCSANAAATCWSTRRRR